MKDVISGNASVRTIKPLQTLMNRAARIMTFSPFGRVDLQLLYSCLQLLDVENVFKLETSKFVFKEKKNLLPVYIGNHFQNATSPNAHSYNLRTAAREDAITFRLSSSKEKSIKSRGKQVWSEIPELIRNSCSIHSFKLSLKTHLINSLL